MKCERSVWVLLLLVAVCIAYAAGNEIDGGYFQKAPYLLFDGSTPEMTLIWQMKDTRQCLIEWGTDTTYSTGSAVTSEYGDNHQHLYTITSLVPGTHYFYQVSCSGNFYPGSFFSAPPASETDAKFMVYGDTRTNYWTHDMVVEGIVSAYTADPDYQSLVFFGGDNVEFGATDSFWQDDFFNDSLANIRQMMGEVPFVPCLGNHELYYVGYTGIDLDTPLFGRYFPYPYVDRRYWSMDYGPVHMTIVDQYPDYYLSTDSGMISQEELTWIESDLSTTDRPWKFILLHEPGWSAGSFYFPENNGNVQELLQPLCEQYGVQVVFGGHNHYYARACKNGVYHLTLGGGGATMYSPYPDYPNVIYTNQEHHFCLVAIEQDSLYLSVVTPENQEFDGFSIIRGQPVSHLLGFVTLNVGPGLVEDVLVAAGSTSDNPDDIGYYGMPIDPGTYDVTASLAGYETQVFEDIEVVSGTETTLDIAMYPTSIEEGGSSFDLHLYSPSPNPFSSSTSIAFTLPEPGPVTLRLYDLSGRLVVTLIDEVIQSGEQSVVLDGSALSPGLYLVRLQTASAAETVKCLLAR